MTSINHPWRYLLLALTTALLLILPQPLVAQSPVGWALPTLYPPNPSSWSPDSGWEREKDTRERDRVADLMTVDDALDHGQALYDAGRFGEAIAPWHQALTLATQQNDRDSMAIAHNYLAIGYQALTQWDTAQQSVDDGLSLLTNLASANHQFLYAQLLSTQGNGQLQTGETDAALESWQQAASIYESLAVTEPLIRTQINQAQALRTLGFYRQAKDTLEDINEHLGELPDSRIKIRALQSLGQTLYRVGDLNQAKAVLTDSAAIAQRLNRPTDVASVQLDLAQTTAALGETDAALGLYRQVQQSGVGAIALDAHLHALALKITRQSPDWSTINAEVSSLYPQLSALPASRWGMNAQVYFSRLLIDAIEPNEIEPNEIELNAIGLNTIGLNTIGLNTIGLNTIGLNTIGTDGLDIDEPDINGRAIAQLLAHSIQQAESLGDRQAAAAALGQLGHLYEHTQQWSMALDLTEQALQSSATPYPTYDDAQLQWQKGRILNAQRRSAKALGAYHAAVKILSTLQQDLVAMNPGIQYSFRDQVEPIYREYVQALLTDIDTLPPHTQQVRMQQSRTTIESLQLAELENFFREACLTYQTQAIDTIDPNAAVIYPIFLDQRLEVILSLPDQPLQHYGVDFATQDHEKLFQTLRSALHPLRSDTAIVPIGQQLYDWMIRPAEEAIAQAHIETLVFVPDGFLRNIPMSVLHDGDRFLIETYNVALTPGMQLLNSQPIAADSFNVLTAGLTDARQGFNALPGVGEEINQIQQLVPSNVLLNDSFTQKNVVEQIEQKAFSVIHLATHGQFGKSPDDTFLLTWDDRIKVREFDSLFQSAQRANTPIELLVLSACQTAEGDSRSALGMAGVAVRSGARSTVATLWAVQDESTSVLIKEFYRLLTQDHVPRAQALRQAQLSLLHTPRYQHPYYWAPFVLIGNWQ